MVMEYGTQCGAAASMCTHVTTGKLALQIFTTSSFLSLLSALLPCQALLQLHDSSFALHEYIRI